MQKVLAAYQSIHVSTVYHLDHAHHIVEGIQESFDLQIISGSTLVTDAGAGNSDTFRGLSHAIAARMVITVWRVSSGHG